MKLIEKLSKEIERNEELLKIYKNLPHGSGYFGAWMIQASLDIAGLALASGDEIKMEEAYKILKENE